MLVSQKIMLHRQKEFSAAGVKATLIAEFGEHLRRFGSGFRLMNGKLS
jgi:hypothetical protein